MYDRVIVAVDESEEARRAARTGFALARLFEAPVRILNVLERSVLDVLRSEPDRDRLREERAELLDELEVEATESGVSVETSVLDGKPAEQIEAVAREEPNPIIVLGRQGRSTVSRKILGGVTERVIESGVAPVLVEPGVESITDPLALDRILVPTDGSPNAEAAFPHAGAIATETGSTVHILAVLDLQRAGGVFNAGGLGAEFVEQLESEAAQTLDSSVGLLAGHSPSLDIETAQRKSTNFDGVSGAIETYTEAVGIDLLVMGSHGRSNVSRQVLGSVTSTVLRSVDVPILVVPRAEETVE